MYFFWGGNEKPDFSKKPIVAKKKTSNPEPWTSLEVTPALRNV